MSISIHDGLNKVSGISIMCLVKDNAEWLRYAFQRFEAMEQIYDVQFHYFFFENNSKDKTHDIITHFLQQKQRKGSLLSDNLPPYKNFGTNYERVQRLSDLRNRLLQSIRPLPTEWTLMIDSQIYFNVESLAQLFACLPAQQQYAMVTPYSTELFSSKMLQSGNPSLNLPDNKFFSVNHYYDSFAFVDLQDHNYWPNCNFIACKKCKETRKADPEKMIPVTQDIIPVRSAFGGFAIVDNTVLNDERVMWKTLDLFDKYSICEHVAFCDSIRNVSGKQIVVMQKVQNIHWVKED